MGGWWAWARNENESQPKVNNSSPVLYESPFNIDFHNVPRRMSRQNGRTARRVAGLVLYDDGTTSGRVRMMAVRVKT